ncbi:MAG: response regulator [Candidatus Eisenbacteria bacterium]|uniref:Response regulator n=1 Tax=Eiseniibacteriota bacterium TaxID=2212470 RepID=A0A956M0S9_UNCEI|nr:response regulator [Candidatus Eisenbacteria bacterium]
MPDLPRILLVDDEPHIVDALSRHLRGEYHILTANSGQEALKVLQTQGAVSVVISDMKMPGMNGVSLLARVRERYPDTVRVVLSGQSDLSDSVRAVNEGRIFRFAVKPCSPAMLREILRDALDQHRLQQSEQTLLQETVRGAVTALVEILSIVRPEAFGQAVRLRRIVHELSVATGTGNSWDAEVAAMFSRIGLVVLPPQLLEDALQGRDAGMDPETVALVPQIADRLVGRIPRLETVREILRFQDRHYDGSGPPAEPRQGDEIPWGARALRLALDFDSLEARGLSPEAALGTLHDRTGFYDPALLDALSRTRVTASGTLLEVPPSRLLPGMRVLADLRDREGQLLLSRGMILTNEAVDRLRLVSRRESLPPTVRVELIEDPTQPGEAEPRTGTQG